MRAALEDSKPAPRRNPARPGVGQVYGVEDPHGLVDRLGESALRLADEFESLCFGDDKELAPVAARMRPRPC